MKSMKVLKASLASYQSLICFSVFFGWKEFGRRFFANLHCAPIPFTFLPFSLFAFLLNLKVITTKCFSFHSPPKRILWLVHFVSKIAERFFHSMGAMFVEAKFAPICLFQVFIFPSLFFKRKIKENLIEKPQ